MNTFFDTLSNATLQRIFKLILKRVLGRYLLDDLILEQISVQSREGKVKIENVKINVDVISEEFIPPESPFVLTSISISSIEATISYSSLLKDGFQLNIEGVVVVVTPVSAQKPATKINLTEQPWQSSRMRAVADSSIPKRKLLDSKVEGLEGINFIAQWVEVLISSIKILVKALRFEVSTGDKSISAMLSISSIEIMINPTSNYSNDTSVSATTKISTSHASIQSLTTHRVIKVFGLNVYCGPNKEEVFSRSHCTQIVEIISTFTVHVRQLATNELFPSYHVEFGIPNQIVVNLTELTCSSILNLFFQCCAKNREPTSETTFHDYFQNSRENACARSKNLLLWLEYVEHCETGNADSMIDFERLVQLTKLYHKSKLSILNNNLSNNTVTTDLSFHSKWLLDPTCASIRNYDDDGDDNEIFKDVSERSHDNSFSQYHSLLNVDMENSNNRHQRPVDNKITKFRVSIRKIVLLFGQDDLCVRTAAKSLQVPSRLNETKNIHVTPSSRSCLVVELENLITNGSFSTEICDLEVFLTVTTAKLSLHHLECFLPVLTFRPINDPLTIISEPHIDAKLSISTLNQSTTHSCADARRISYAIVCRTVPIAMSVIDMSHYGRLLSKLLPILPENCEKRETSQVSDSNSVFNLNVPSIDIYFSPQSYTFLDPKVFEIFREQLLLSDNQFSWKDNADDGTIADDLLSNMDDIGLWLHCDSFCVKNFVSVDNVLAETGQLCIKLWVRDCQTRHIRSKTLVAMHPEESVGISNRNNRLVCIKPTPISKSDHTTESLRPIITHEILYQFQAYKIIATLSQLEYNILIMIASVTFGDCDTTAIIDKQSKPTSAADTVLSSSVLGLSITADLFFIFLNYSHISTCHNLLCREAKIECLLEMSKNIFVGLQFNSIALFNSIGLKMIPALDDFAAHISDPSNSVCVVTYDRPIDTKLKQNSMSAELNIPLNPVTKPRIISFQCNFTQVVCHMDLLSSFVTDIKCFLTQPGKSIFEVNEEADSADFDMIMVNFFIKDIALAYFCQNTLSHWILEAESIHFRTNYISTSLTSTYYVDFKSIEFSVANRKISVFIHKGLKEDLINLISCKAANCTLLLLNQDNLNTSKIKVDCNNCVINIHRDVLTLIQDTVKVLATIITPEIAQQKLPVSVPSKRNQLPTNTSGSKDLNPTVKKNDVKLPSTWMDSLSNDSFSPISQVAFSNSDINNLSFEKHAEVAPNLDVSLIENFYSAPSLEKLLPRSSEVTWSPSYNDEESVSGEFYEEANDFNAVKQIRYLHNDENDNYEQSDDSVYSVEVDSLESKCRAPDENTCVETELQPLTSVFVANNFDTISGDIILPSNYVQGPLESRESVSTPTVDEEIHCGGVWFDKIELRQHHVSIAPITDNEEYMKVVDSRDVLASVSINLNVFIRIHSTDAWRPINSKDNINVFESNDKTKSCNDATTTFLEVKAVGCKGNITTYAETSFDGEITKPIITCTFSAYDMVVGLHEGTLRPRKVIGVLKHRDISKNIISVNSATYENMDRRCHVSIIPSGLCCYIDDQILNFFKLWQSPNGVKTTTSTTESDFYFSYFSISPIKLKFSYHSDIDVTTLRAGDYFQVFNLFPVDGAILVLQQINFSGIRISRLIGAVLESYQRDLYDNHVMTIITSTSLIKPAKNISSGLAKLVMVPLRKNKSVVRELNKGTQNLVHLLTRDILDTSYKISKNVANLITTMINSHENSMRVTQRDSKQPRNLIQGFQRGGNSIRREFSRAGDILIAIPMESASHNLVRSIPLAILHSSVGGAEAMSYTLLGLRNSVDPNLQYDEEDMFDFSM